MGEHKCTKEKVDWEEKPSGFEENTIEWHGKCSCGREVYEIYRQEAELFDSDTGNAL